MSKRDYEVLATVRYIVSASSETEALKIIDEGAEYPVTPFNEGTYCDDVFDIKVKPLEIGK